MTKNLDWKAAALAGIIAGLVFLMLEMALIALVQGQSPWGPPRMMAAIVMGDGVLPPPATFDFGIVMVAMMVHAVMSILLGVIFAWLHSALKMNLVTALVAGTVFGLAIYFVNFYAFTTLFPWFAMARGPIGIFSHAMFGLVLGLAYHSLARRDANKGGQEAVV